MNKEVEEEIKKLIEEKGLDCSIEEFIDNLCGTNWEYISSYHKLSENFIKEFKDKVDWGYISRFQKLSENFVREFKDKVNWECISEYQKLSEDFYKEFKDKININYLKKNKNIDVDIEKITTIKVIFKDSGKKEKTINNRFEILDIRG